MNQDKEILKLNFPTTKKYKELRILGIRLTLVPPRYSIWGLWNIILKRCLSLKKSSPLKKRAENFFINCGGQRASYVLDVATEKPGAPAESRIDAATVIFKFPLLLALSFKILGFRCVCGFERSGTSLVKNRASVLLDLNGFWDLKDTKQHGLCCTN